MPGYLVHVGAQVTCSHAGQAQPTVSNPSVTVSDQATVLTSSVFQIAGCSFPPPPTANGPCVTGQWLSGTTRVTSNGEPLVISVGTSTCTPTGTPLMVVETQTRVTAT
jgi:hypothetical protein